MFRRVFCWGLMLAVAAATGAVAQTDTERWEEWRAREGAVGSASFGGLLEGSDGGGRFFGCGGIESWNFSGGPPGGAGGWSLQSDNDIRWTKASSGGCGILHDFAGNITGGAGDYACVVPLLMDDPFSAWDTWFAPPSFDLSTWFLTITVNVNYQNVDIEVGDIFVIEYSVDGGPWQVADSNVGPGGQALWNEDVGAFASLPGETLDADLTSLAGESDVRVRFRYFDPPNTGLPIGLYIELDDLTLNCELVPVELQSFDVE